jgi:hypothetical protein
MPTLSDGDIARVANVAGLGSHEAVKMATAICLAESGGRYGERGVCPSRTNDWGLWQINSPSHPTYNRTRLCNEPPYNAGAMVAISKVGKVWTPWTTYRNGQYRQYLARADKAATEAIFGGGKIVAPGRDDFAGPKVPDLPDPLGGIEGALRAVGDVLGAPFRLVANVLGILADPEWWKRLGVGLAGALLLVIAGVLLVRSLGADVLKKATGG